MKVILTVTLVFVVCLLLVSCRINIITDTPDISDVSSTDDSSTNDYSKPAISYDPSNDSSSEEITSPQQAYIEVMREGEISIIPVEIAIGTVGKYTIAYDPEYFVFSFDDGVDRFVYESWGSDPNVYYNVSSINCDTNDYISDLKAENGKPYDEFETLIGNYKATAVFFESDNCYLHYYIIDCESATYVIEAQFVLEMYEGLYAIMQELFDTFTITE